MPARSRAPLASPLVDASPDIVNTVPLVAPLIVKNIASMFPNPALVAVALPPAPSVIRACAHSPAPLLKNNPTVKLLGTLLFTVKLKRLVNVDVLPDSNATPLFMLPPAGLSIFRDEGEVKTELKDAPGVKALT